MRLTIFGIAALLGAGLAHGQVVISQIYGGGGNSTAPLHNDFIELFNRGASSVTLTNWSVQYASSTGTGNFGANANQLTVINATIPAGGYYLVGEAAGTGGGASLPATDATGTINMSGTDGKVALVDQSTTLGCNGGSAPCSSAQLAHIKDLVGYGNANFFEGSAAGPTLSNTTAGFRAGSGCTDTDNNSSDFSTAAPAPRNSSSAAHSCFASTNPAGSGTASPVVSGSSTTFNATITPGSNPTSASITVTCDLTAIGGSSTFPLTGTLTSVSAMYTVPGGTAANTYSLPCTITDDQARHGSFNISLTVTSPPTFRLISEINGSGATSPYANTTARTRGIVSDIRGTNGSTKGFYIESATADRDADSNTSEGLLVFIGSGSLPSCAVVGNSIQIDGTVSDFVSNTAPVGSIPLTELATITNCTVLGTDTLPAPVTLTTSNIAAGGSATQARKFLSMRVTIPSATVVGGSLGNLTETSATATASGVFFVTLAGVPRPFRGPGILDTRRPSDAAATVPHYNGSPEVLRIDTFGLTGGTAFEVANGAPISNISGVMDYVTSDGQYQIYSNAAGLTGGNVPGTPTLSATPVPTALSSDLTIANFNIERFYNDVNDGNSNPVTLSSTAYQGRLNKLSMAVRNVLRMPDIITFEEMEGPNMNAGVPSGPQVFPVPIDIVAKINSDAVAAGQGNPAYDWCEFGTNDASLISIAVVFKTGKVSKQACTQYGAATMFIKPLPPNNPSVLNDRPPVMFLANVTAPGSDTPLSVRIVANHLRSFDSVDSPGDTGDFPRTKRNEQAIYLAKLVSGNVAGEQTTNWNANDNLVVTGDFNAYDFSDGYVDSLNCITGVPGPANAQYFSAAESAVTSPCTSIYSPALTNLTASDPLQRYSYSFSGAAQRIDHILVNTKIGPRVRQFAYARNDADFPEGPTYRSNFNRPERVSDHDAPVLYLKLPVEVTSRTRVNASALVLNRATGRYNGTISVTNTGAAALTGPVYVFFDNLPSGVTLPDLPAYNGTPYATISVAGLAPGATSGAFAISFADPSNARISYTTRRFDVNF